VINLETSATFVCCYPDKCVDKHDERECKRAGPCNKSNQ
jgi:hypothetical protein